MSVTQSLAGALPDEHVDAARAQHRPHGHLEGAGVGAGDDADEVIGGDAQDLAGLVDRELKPRLAGFRAMRAAKECGFEVFYGIAGALCAGTGGKMRHRGARRAL